MKKKLCSWFLVLTMVLGLLPTTAFAAEDAAIPFAAKSGETALSVTQSETDYTYTVVTQYDENWNPVATEEHTVDLFVVTAPADTKAVTLDFGEDLRIAYTYDANGIYTGNCSGKEGGYESNGQIGLTTASVTDLTAYVRVQTPYDESWQSDFLYAVAFEVEEMQESAPFTAKSGEDVLPVVKSETDYTYTVTEYDDNWNPIKTEEHAVALYKITADTTITEVTLDFGEDLRIAYTYDANGTYTGDCSGKEGGYESNGQIGLTTASVTDLTAYVRVQTPYDESWQSDFLYAVAFEVEEMQESAPFTAKSGEDVLPVVKSETDYTYTVTEYDDNWNPIKTEEHAVALYKITADTTITEVTLDFGEDLRIAYTYDANGTYTGDCSGKEGGYESNGQIGLTTASVTDLTAYVRVQTPYDANWQSEFLYAVAFDIPAEEPDAPIVGTVSIEALLSNIAAGYVENSDEWIIMDMAAYEDATPDSTYKTTADTRQAYIDSAIAAVTAEGAGESAFAKAIVILQSIGADPQKLYPADSDTPVSAVDGLKNLETYSSSAWVAPYTLMALNQGDYGTDELEQTIITSVLANQAEDGSWSEWGDSIQTTANMIAGLSFYYDSNETVKTAVDKAVTFLSAAQKADGTYDAYGSGSDANTAAMVVIALSALDIDPNTDERFIKGENSALDGLLSFALADNSAFGYTDNTSANTYATEQGFRALIAAKTLRNVYDFSANEVSPAYGSGTPSDDEDDNSGSTSTPDTNITVSFTIKSHQTTWIRNLDVELEEASTVSDLIYEVAELDEKLSFVDNNGYISSVTYDGVTWAEFDAGRNSGWKYKVNGKAPVLGMSDRVLEDGDKVVWYYVTDYTQDSTKDENPVELEIPVEEDVVLPFTDVTEDSYYYEPLQWAVKNGITSGTSDTTFSPDGDCTRAQMVTFLWRAAGSPEPVHAETVFADVEQSAYYYNALLWAVENGITSGTSATTFSPDAVCTRGQMAMFLYRNAKTPAANSTNSFSDVSDTAYYKDAVNWAKAEGITAGTSATTFSPDVSCTRAQMVTFLYRACAE